MRRLPVLLNRGFVSQPGPASAGRTRSKGIEDDLAKAKAKVAALEQKLLVARASESRGEGKEVSWSHHYLPARLSAARNR
eukprot:COSAG02_NODE_808_length_16924_cov_117.299733_17_plen_80_part_00